MFPPHLIAQVTRAIALAALATSAAALNGRTPPALAGSGTDGEDLTELSLEELMNLEVTVASKSKQRLSDVPAAVYVITGDELRRSGHSSIPEALRMVPGIHVSHWTNDMWDVTARGYGTGLSLTNNAYLNQLLVMIDGVPVYTPLYAGVWWALQDVPLADVDRIEIIRGPGGIVWGSNAVHGVVNVITRSSAETQGTQLHGWYGGEDRHYSVRHGLRFGKDGVENGSLRVWGKKSTYETPDEPFGGYSQDWTLDTAGFRADWEDGDGIVYNVWARAYQGRFRGIGFDLTTFAPFSSLSHKQGGQLAFSRTNPDTGETWSAWYQQDRQDLPTLAEIDIEQVDLEYARELTLAENNRLNFGVGFRHVDSELFGDDPFWLDFDPRDQHQNNLRAFAADTISFPDHDAELVLGVQVEDNEFTGAEWQPSVRGSWRPNDATMVWGAVSRAVRTPSLEEVSLTPDSRFVGDPDFRSEVLLSGELGVRWQASERASLDLALYVNDYEELHNRTFDGVFSDQLGNDAAGNTYGGELAVDLKPTDRWSLRAAYSQIHERFVALNGSNAVTTEDYTPRHLFNLRSYYDLTDELELDAGVYVVNGLNGVFEVAEYWRGDVRLGWNPTADLSLSVGVQSFDDPSHSQFDAFDNVRRQAYVSMTWSPGPREVD